MEEIIKIRNKYTGLVEETINGHLNLDYYMTLVKDSIREKAILDLEQECIKITEENIQKAEEGYKIEVE